MKKPLRMYRKNQSSSIDPRTRQMLSPLKTSKKVENPSKSANLVIVPRCKMLNSHLERKRKSLAANQDLKLSHNQQ